MGGEAADITGRSLTERHDQAMFEVGDITYLGFAIEQYSFSPARR